MTILTLVDWTRFRDPATDWTLQSILKVLQRNIGGHLDCKNVLKREQKGPVYPCSRLISEVSHYCLHSNLKVRDTKLYGWYLFANWVIISQKGCAHLMASLDLSSAFDKVNVRLLLKRLKKIIGLPDIVSIVYCVFFVSNFSQVK